MRSELAGASCPTIALAFNVCINIAYNVITRKIWLEVVAKGGFCESDVQISENVVMMLWMITLRGQHSRTSACEKNGTACIACSRPETYQQQLEP